MSPDARRMAPHAAAVTRRGEERGPEPAHPIAIGRGLVALGALLRIARWFANRSLWGDEGSLAINVVERSFAGLAGPLAHGQAAPIGFLWLEKAATLAFGESEPALRLVPLLASLASLPLFLRLAREILGPRDALFALALFAISEPLVFYASEVKPYASDVLVCLAITGLALRALRRGPSPARLAALAAAGLVGPWLSLPAVFVCAGAGLAVGLACIRRGDASAALGTAAICALWLAGFAIEYALLLRPLHTNQLLRESWQGYFAPLPISAEALGWWGQRFLGFFNDPLGLPDAALAAILFAAGGVRLARRAGWETLLLLAPIGLVLAASLVGLHPFPTSSSYRLADRYYPFTGRLLLFTVPLALPCIAAGAAILLDSRSRFRRLAGVAALALLCAAPARQAAWNLVDPPQIHELRPLMPRLVELWAPGDRIYSQQYATGVVAYYARRFGLGALAGELALEGPEQIFRLAAQLRDLEPGQRFWLVTLHHPHWRSESERDAIAAALAPIAERVETLEGERAEASLWRVTRDPRVRSSQTPSPRHRAV